MGENIMSNYIFISGFDLNNSNRGTAALGYGSVSFLLEKGYLKEGDKLISFRYVNNILKKSNRGYKVNKIKISNKYWTHYIINIPRFELKLYLKTGLLLPLSNLSVFLKKISLFAAINGGDGYSDIYSTQSFLGRLNDLFICLKAKKRLIFLPQTIGPFNLKSNLEIAKKFLSYAEKIFVRDDRFVNELNKYSLQYELTKDLSYYMKPEEVSFNIKSNSVGINVSGLCYYNKFNDLSGQFDEYPYLINRLIDEFTQIGKNVYLIPHSYCYNSPETNNDDYIACKEVYGNYKDNKNVFFVDKNLISPQIKYVISKMDFFIGARMHANFAAIYTNVPLFGLAYSYKFEGAFRANGISSEQTAMINNITKEEAENIILKILNFYKSIKNEK